MDPFWLKSDKEYLTNNHDLFVKKTRAPFSECQIPPSSLVFFYTFRVELDWVRCVFASCVFARAQS